MTSPVPEERRKFFRVNFKRPLEYRSFDDKNRTHATCQNVSQTGILFQTEHAPQMSSILWMGLDIRTLGICKEIEKRALIFNEGLVGKVVRVEEDSTKDNVYDVGVCFITQDQRNTSEVQKILEGLSKAA